MIDLAMKLHDLSIMLLKIWSKYNYLFGVASGKPGACLVMQRSRVVSGRRV